MPISAIGQLKKLFVNRAVPANTSPRHFMAAEQKAGQLKEEIELLGQGITEFVLVSRRRDDLWLLLPLEKWRNHCCFQR